MSRKRNSDRYRKCPLIATPSVISSICPSIETAVYMRNNAYLRNEALILRSEIPVGYVLIKFQEAILGFVKNIGNRTENIYPHEWHICKRIM